MKTKSLVSWDKSSKDSNIFIQRTRSIEISSVETFCMTFLSLSESLAWMEKELPNLQISESLLSSLRQWTRGRLWSGHRIGWLLRSWVKLHMIPRLTFGLWGLLPLKWHLESLLCPKFIQWEQSSWFPWSLPRHFPALAAIPMNSETSSLSVYRKILRNVQERKISWSIRLSPTPSLEPWFKSFWLIVSLKSKITEELRLNKLQLYVSYLLVYLIPPLGRYSH